MELKGKLPLSTSLACTGRGVVAITLLSFACEADESWTVSTVNSPFSPEASIEEAALLSDEVLVTGLAPINVIKSFIPPKSKTSETWQKLGLRKSLEDKCFHKYLKSIRDTSYQALQKET